MSAPDVFAWYLASVTGPVAVSTDASPHLLAATALGKVHRRLAQGYPLTRSELLAEVARLCGEKPAEEDVPEDDPQEAWLTGFARGAEAERKTVLDAAENETIAIRKAQGASSYPALAALDAWVAEQRAVKP